MVNEGGGVAIRAYHTDDSPTEARPQGQTFITVAIEAGWPRRCLRAETRYMAGGGWTVPNNVLPLRARLNARKILIAHDLPLEPMWSGLAINTLFIAIALWLVVAAPGDLRRVRRRWQGRCVACGYPPGVSPVCTECGAELPARTRREALPRG